MGQKVNPVGIRTGIIRGWNSIWYEDKKEYKINIHEDLRIQKYIAKVYKNSGVSKITIDRLADKINVYIHTSKPGMIIGKKGADIEELKKNLQNIVTKKVFVNIVEIKKPDKDAKIVSTMVAQQIETRMPYRRAIKQAINNAKRAGVEGIKVMISGRLNGADMARREIYKDGRIPLHTLRADIDFGFTEALTTYGLIGIKVWIYNGDVFNKKDNVEEDKYTVKRKLK